MGGLSAVSAVLAHGGLAGLRNVSWLSAAAAGSLLVALALTVALSHAAVLRRRLDRIGAGDPRACVVDPDSQAELFVMVTAAVVCQAGAHAALLTAGVHAQPGVVAAPTLHVLLAFLTALAVCGLDRALSRLCAAVSEAVHAMLVLLQQLVVQPYPAPGVVLPSRTALRGLRSRAPPIAA